jgi:hypothetical protein
MEAVIAREELGALFELQGQTLERIHPSWLPELAPELGSAALDSATGRRWLANRLSKVSASLFGLPADADHGTAPALLRAGWFIILLQNPLECALDLGSLALATSVRTVISRAGVSALRSVLGDTRYERALSAAAAPEAPANDLAFVSGDVAERLIRCGAHELAAYASHLHPALGDSVKLSFECNWWDVAAPPLLAPSVAEACLRVRSSDGESADE